MESVFLHIPTVQEIVIVDNCSEDTTMKVSEELKEKYENIKIIGKRENVGLGRGLNIGISAINCDYVLVTNPDIIVQGGDFPSFLEMMVDGRVGIVVPGRTNTDLLPCDFGIPFQLKDCSASTESYKGKERTFQIPIFHGDFFLLRKSAWENVGGFDEDIFLYDEEETLSLKMRDRGYFILYFDNYKVTHTEMKSVKSQLAKNRFFYFENSQRNHPFLYYKYIRDGPSKRLLWWVGYFLNAIIYSIRFKSLHPILYSVDIFLNQTRRNLYNFNFHWTFSNFFRLWLAHLYSMARFHTRRLNR